MGGPATLRRIQHDCHCPLLLIGTAVSRKPGALPTTNRPRAAALPGLGQAAPKRKVTPVARVQALEQMAGASGHVTFVLMYSVLNVAGR